GSAPSPPGWVCWGVPQNWHPPKFQLVPNAEFAHPNSQFWVIFHFFIPTQRREKIERRQQEVESELKLWDPHNDPNAQGDAFKTLFVARVNYDTTESKLRREFEVYGPIKRVSGEGSPPKNAPLDHPVLSGGGPTCPQM
uniref:Uncharacterized protein n=1 Tax=Junco hyemalis TaxID=40217 RepID=A0A8C5ILH6_JUNHY